MQRSPWTYLYIAGAAASAILFYAGQAVLGAAVIFATAAVFVLRKRVEQ